MCKPVILIRMSGPSVKLSRHLLCHVVSSEKKKKTHTFPMELFLWKIAEPETSESVMKWNLEFATIFCLIVLASLIIAVPCLLQGQVHRVPRKDRA